MVKRIILFAVSIGFIACASGDKPNQSFLYVDQFPEAIKLSAEIIAIEDVLCPISVHHIGPYLVIIEGRSNKYVHIYDADSFEKQIDIINKGRGPRETPSGVMPVKQFNEEEGNNQMWLSGGLAFQGLLNIDKTIAAGEPVFELFYDYKQDDMLPYISRMTFCNMINDSTFISLSLYDPSITDNGNNYILKLDYRSKRFFDPVYISDYNFENTSSFAGLVTGFEFNGEYNKAVGAFQYMDRLHIIDLVRKEISIIGFESMPDANLPDIDGKICNISVASTDDHIFVFQPDRIDNNKTIVKVLNWNGNSVVELSLDMKISNPAISNQYIYATTEPEMEIVRYKIDFLN